ncbi:MAG: restriction endonuclease subunit S [Candidatus Aminicenantes bacterium]|nr:MAG: restriction endonuclease subunit S [Candidatus Aminicenantes bacterium]
MIKKVTLEEICDINIGKTPKRKEKRYWGKGHPWVTISDIDDFFIYKTNEEVTDAAIKECKMRIVPQNTLLFSYKLTIGKVAITRVPLYTNEAIAALIIKDESTTNLKYLYYVLKYSDFRFKTDRAAKGLTLNKQKLKEIKIPLPPFTEQKQIATVLDIAEGLRRKRQQAIDLLDELLRSIFLDMFGPNAYDYKRWQFIKIEDLAKPGTNTMRTGPFGSDLLHSEFVDEGIFVVGIDNAVNNRFSWAKKRFITKKKYKKLKRYTLYPGDVLVTIMGTLGKSAVVPDDIPLSINSKHLAALTLNKQKANPYFISYSIYSDPYILHQIKKNTRGAIMEGLNLRIIKKLKLKLPPLNLQNHFETIFKHIEAIKEKMQKSLEEMDNLFHSLMQQAFKGELKFNETFHKETC